MYIRRGGSSETSFFPPPPPSSRHRRCSRQNARRTIFHGHAAADDDRLRIYHGTNGGLSKHCSTSNILRCATSSLSAGNSMDVHGVRFIATALEVFDIFDEVEISKGRSRSKFRELRKCIPRREFVNFKVISIFYAACNLIG